MRAGRLRHQLSLQSPTFTNTSVATMVTSWGTAATIWGSIEPLRGREFYDAALINSDVKAKIIIRYTSDIAPNYKIIFGARTFLIESVINIEERNKEMQLMVIEEVIK